MSERHHPPAPSRDRLPVPFLPPLLLTRPAPQSAAFLAEAEGALGRPLPAIVAPLSRILPSGAPVPGDGGLIFTSGRAVELARPLADRRAWCVGDATAALAREAGAEAVSAGGTVEELLALLLHDFGRGALALPVTHLRGEHSAGNLVARLRAAGVAADEIVLYSAEAQPLSPQATAALAPDNRLIAPVFSPRAARLLAAGAPHPPALVLAISAAAAQPFHERTRVEVAAAPDGSAMLRLLLRQLAPAADALP